MNKLDLTPPAITLTPASFPDHQPARRLIVLVPSLEFDSASLARRVWELANVTGAHIQFLGLYSDSTQELGLRRELVTMAAMVKDDVVSAEAVVVFGKDWVDVVKTRAHYGDVIVCLAGHRVGLPRRRLSQILQSDLSLPLFILAELNPRNDFRLNWRSQVAAWMGSAAIIFGFFLLQVRINPLATNWTHAAMLIASILVECWMILGWNSLFE